MIEAAGKGGSGAVVDFTPSILAVRDRIDEAARRAGRDPSSVALMIATKTQDASRVQSAARAVHAAGLGVARFGENRAREGRLKAGASALPSARWAMIGHVQSNKVDDVLAFAHELHSLDRLPLAEALDRRLQRVGRGLDVLVQVNTSNEPTKFGLPPEDVAPFLENVRFCASLSVRGFMTLAIASDDARSVRHCFRTLRDLRDRARQGAPRHDLLNELSMGMSSDFEIAVEEGATVVRIGEAIFGHRNERPVGGWWPEALAGAVKVEPA